MKGFCVSKEDIGDLTKWCNINNLVDTIEDIYSGLLYTLNIIDVNGSYNILRKAIPNAFVNGIGGVVVHPRVIKTPY